MNPAVQRAIDIAGTQQRLADLSGLKQATISWLASGRNGKRVQPRYETATKISSAIGERVSWQEIMSGTLTDINYSADSSEIETPDTAEAQPTNGRHEEAV